MGPHTVTATTVHEIQEKPAGTIPLTSHAVPPHFVLTPEHVIDACARPLWRAVTPGSGHRVGRPTEKTAWIPMFARCEPLRVQERDSPKA